MFVVYPEGLSVMPVATLWALLFFFMMLVLGFSSQVQTPECFLRLCQNRCMFPNFLETLQFSIVECVFTALMDEYPKLLRSTPWRPIMLRLTGCILFFLLSIPMVTEVILIFGDACDSVVYTYIIMN